MTFLIILLIVIIIFIGYVVKLNHDLLVYKDNLLRALAGVDAVIIKKNLKILDVLGYAQETMQKEQTLITELFNIRHDINKITPKIANAPERYKMQQDFDRKIEILLGAVSRYPELKNNAGFQSSVNEFHQMQNAFDEKVKYYNSVVDKLNWLIHTFPSSVLAQMSHTKEPPPNYEK